VIRRPGSGRHYFAGHPGSSSSSEVSSVGPATYCPPASGLPLSGAVAVCSGSGSVLSAGHAARVAHNTGGPNAMVYKNVVGHCSNRRTRSALWQPAAKTCRSSTKGMHRAAKAETSRITPSIDWRAETIFLRTLEQCILGTADLKLFMQIQQFTSARMPRPAPQSGKGRPLSNASRPKARDRLTVDSAQTLISRHRFRHGPTGGAINGALGPVLASHDIRSKFLAFAVA
jgi:hypothetical protein